jgi:hypothetical protein
MISVLITIITMAVISIAIPFLWSLSNQSYGSQLEQYINSKHPTNIGDIERLTNDFQRKSAQRYL